VLIGGDASSVRGRVVRVLAAAAGSLLAGVLAAAAGGGVGVWELPPRPSEPVGVSLGLVAAFIVFFEMLLVPRKRLRGRRLGATQIWMRWHIWLGFASLPVVVVHAGFGFGGPLPAVTLALFLAVYASGVWGLILQQWLPQKLAASVTDESVHAEADRLAAALGDEAQLTDWKTSPQVVAELIAFRDRELLPYLYGQHEGVTLSVAGTATREFARLRGILPPVAHPTLDRWRALADDRRRLDTQRRLHGWLHGWLVVHVPLSVAMTVLMVLHAIRALKYW